MPIKVISCKAKPPVEGGEVVAEQMSAAHRYYNRLIELHRAFRADADELKRQHIPGLIEAETSAESLEAQLLELRTQVKARNAAARRKTASPDDRQAVADLSALLKQARQLRKDLRGTAGTNPAYQADLAGLVVRYHGTLESPDSTRRKGGLFKEARAACGVYPGTYLRVEQAVEAACKKPGLPKFRRWDGGGLVGPQITPPITVGEMIEAGDSRVRMRLLPSPASKRASQRVRFWVRVASAGREPVWAVLDAHLSRGRLPDDAVISWVSIVRRQSGTRRHRHPTIPEGVWLPYYEWSVQLTVRTSEEKPARPATGAAGVNLGWRTMPDGSLRVGYVVGSDGANQEVRLPAEILARFDRCQHIQGVRDGLFNEARDTLVAWLADHEHPHWLDDATEHLWQWRSHRRLAGVLHAWSEQRFVGDEDIFAALVAWRAREDHLETYEVMNRARAERKRRLFYRELANCLRRQYATVLVDDSDYRQLGRLPRAESNEVVNATARFNARRAAVGLLRQTLVAAGAIESPAENITRTCHACCQVFAADRSAEIVHACPGCGLSCDQDENAACNLLARATVMAQNAASARVLEGVDDKEDVAVASQPAGRWARRKANRSQANAQVSD